MCAIAVKLRHHWSHTANALCVRISIVFIAIAPQRPHFGAVAKYFSQDFPSVDSMTAKQCPMIEMSLFFIAYILQKVKQSRGLPDNIRVRSEPFSCLLIRVKSKRAFFFKCSSINLISLLFLSLTCSNV